MKLIRFGEKGYERPGLVDTTGVIRDLSTRIDDICGPVLAPEMLDELRRLDLQGLPEVDGDCRLGPPVSAVGKIICVGLNYNEHAEESAMDVPAEPVLFTKAVTAITGAFDAVVLPKGATQADWDGDEATLQRRRKDWNADLPELSAVSECAQALRDVMFASSKDNSPG